MYIDGDGNTCTKYYEYRSGGLEASKGGHTQTSAVDIIVAIRAIIFQRIQFLFFFVNMKLLVANITCSG